MNIVRFTAYNFMDTISDSISLHFRNMEEETESFESQLSNFRKDSNDVSKAVRLLEDDIRQIKNSIQSTG